MALAIFDLDNTLIAGDSDHAWGEFLVEQGIVDADTYRNTNDKFYRDYQEGSLDIHEYLNFALKPLAEHSLEQLQSWRDQFFMQKITPLILPKAQALVSSHQNRGDTTLIITATNRFVTEPIASAFGISHLIATEPELDENGYTGKVAGTPSFKEGKIVRLEHWLQDNPHSLEGSTFYSDSHNDIPLMEKVEFPIAIDPDEALIRHCKRHQWPIRSLRD